jgi:alkanesulfonate monooxygenase SsuD/methylene tetrahydromethanopterin reductase-like flavin-dependent oxidoreductase (luciferase family)
MTEATSRSADPPVVKIGVLLPQPPDDLGEWLAEATAFEAAGADALWIDSGPALEPITLAAALAALTYRSLLVVGLPGGDPDPRVLATAERLSRDRLALSTGADLWADEVTLMGERWLQVPPPEGRTAWRETLAGAAERGVYGLLVPADSRLLDLLRNPGDPDGRHDLHLAQG